MSTHPAPEPASRAVVTAIIGVAAHAILWFLLVVALVTVAPSYERIFSDFQMKLPHLTTAVLEISRWCQKYWYVLPLVAVPLLAGDGAVLFLLASTNRWLARCWLWLWIVLALVAGVLVTLSITIPYAQLREALAR